MASRPNARHEGPVSREVESSIPPRSGLRCRFITSYVVSGLIALRLSMIIATSAPSSARFHSCFRSVDRRWPPTTKIRFREHQSPPATAASMSAAIGFRVAGGMPLAPGTGGITPASGWPHNGAAGGYAMGAGRFPAGAEPLGDGVRPGASECASKVEQRRRARSLDQRGRAGRELFRPPRRERGSALADCAYAVVRGEHRALGDDAQRVHADPGPTVDKPRLELAVRLGRVRDQHRERASARHVQRVPHRVAEAEEAELRRPLLGRARQGLGEVERLCEDLAARLEHERACEDRLASDEVALGLVHAVEALPEQAPVGARGVMAPARVALDVLRREALAVGSDRVGRGLVHGARGVERREHSVPRQRVVLSHARSVVGRLPAAEEVGVERCHLLLVAAARQDEHRLQRAPRLRAAALERSVQAAQRHREPRQDRPRLAGPAVGLAGRARDDGAELPRKGGRQLDVELRHHRVSRGEGEHLESHRGEQVEHRVVAQEHLAAHVEQRR
mmetsp:Transcript_18123/g.44986  ORF Transcript_18123/g.44986 Transcript_18123/m.44986 type:complete len:507 (-) Transcript_18123:680-2200(-)